MPDTDIGQTVTGDMAGVVQDFSVPAETTDGPTGTKETEYINQKWTTQLGYYKQIPELRAAIDAKARWAVGKGFSAEEVTQMLLMGIKGFGKDTFNTILENAIRTYQIGGDSFDEIIRDSKDDVIVNLKPLDPSTIKIIANKEGIITRYEQIGKVKQPVIKFKPEQILHLSRNRVADEIHGVSMIDAVEEIILSRNEAMTDMKTLMHRHVKPIFIHKLDTDDPAKIAAYKIKADKAHADGENLYIPKGAVEVELSAVPANATLNPLPWIQQLNQYFFQAAGVPQIIVGGSQELTEATAKIAYLAFEQTIEEEQLYIEEQILSQLNIEIELEFPASLENDMLTGQGKAEKMVAATPEDTTAKIEESPQETGGPR